MVKSKSHAIMSTSSSSYLECGKIVCDQNCTMWICSHCVAVAHCIGCASNYALWLSASASYANITKLTTRQISKRIGKSHVVVTHINNKLINQLGLTRYRPLCQVRNSQ